MKGSPKVPVSFEVTCLSQVNSCSHTYLLHPLTVPWSFRCRIPSFLSSHLTLFHWVQNPSRCHHLTDFLSALFSIPLSFCSRCLLSRKDLRDALSLPSWEKWAPRKEIIFPNTRQQTEGRIRITRQTTPLLVCEGRPWDFRGKSYYT